MEQVTFTNNILWVKLVIQLEKSQLKQKKHK